MTGPRPTGRNGRVLHPLTVKGRIAGAIEVQGGSRTDGRWGRHPGDDESALLANQLSIALENARLYDEARRAYQELKDAQARIIQSEKMAVLGTFASGLAHEVWRSTAASAIPALVHTLWTPPRKDTPLEGF